MHLAPKDSIDLVRIAHWAFPDIKRIKPVVLQNVTKMDTY